MQKLKRPTCEYVTDHVFKVRKKIWATFNAVNVQECNWELFSWFMSVLEYFEMWLIINNYVKYGQSLSEPHT